MAPPPVVINTEEVAESAVNDIEVLSLAEAAAKVGVVTSLISTPTTTSAQTGGDISDTAASSTSEEDEETAAANTVRFCDQAVSFDIVAMLLLTVQEATGVREQVMEALLEKAERSSLETADTNTILAVAQATEKLVSKKDQASTSLAVSRDISRNNLQINREVLSLNHVVVVFCRILEFKCWNV